MYVYFAQNQVTSPTSRVGSLEFLTHYDSYRQFLLPSHYSDILQAAAFVRDRAAHSSPVSSKGPFGVLRTQTLTKASNYTVNSRRRRRQTNSRVNAQSSSGGADEMAVRKRNKTSQKSALASTAKDYCSSTSLHGFSYWVSTKRTPERLFWVLIVLVGLAFGTFIMKSTVQV